MDEVTGGGIKQINDGEPTSGSTSPPPTGPQEAYVCQCGRNYKSRQALWKHRKNCNGAGPSYVCEHCGRGFATHQGLRLHLKRSHPTSFNEELQQIQKEPESSLLNKLAVAEARYDPVAHRNQLYRILSEATGLTKDQVRHPREKPMYKELLEMEKCKASDNEMTNKGNGEPSYTPETLGRDNQTVSSSLHPAYTQHPTSSQHSHRQTHSPSHLLNITKHTPPHAPELPLEQWSWTGVGRPHQRKKSSDHNSSAPNQRHPSRPVHLQNQTKHV